MRGMLGLSCESRADGLRQKWGRQSGIFSAMFIDILMFKALSLTTVSVRRLWVPSGACPQSTDVPERLSAFPKTATATDWDRRGNAGTVSRPYLKPTWSYSYWRTIRCVPAASVSYFSFYWIYGFNLKCCMCCCRMWQTREQPSPYYCHWFPLQWRGLEDPLPLRTILGHFSVCPLVCTINQSIYFCPLILSYLLSCSPSRSKFPSTSALELSDRREQLPDPFNIIRGSPEDASVQKFYTGGW